MPKKLKIVISDEDFFNIFKSSDKNEMINILEFILKKYGTKLPCNRFDIGNSIEFALGEHLENKCGFKIEDIHNEKRYDIKIDNYKKLSIKYSSSGDITLHNSNSNINTDLEMKDTFLITLNHIYLITKKEILKQNINISEFLVNTGDSLKLKRTFLNFLINKNYPFIFELKINYNKKECQNKSTSRAFYENVKKEIKELKELCK